MANVNQINVKVKTSNRGVVSGTSGDVYLGIGGREFHLAIYGSKDFRAGETEEFVLGEETNIGVFPDDNDPRSPYQMVLPKACLSIRSTSVLNQQIKMAVGSLMK